MIETLLLVKKEYTKEKNKNKNNHKRYCGKYKLKIQEWVRLLSIGWYDLIYLFPSIVSSLIYIFWEKYPSYSYQITEQVVATLRCS